MTIPPGGRVPPVAYPQPRAESSPVRGQIQPGHRDPATTQRQWALGRAYPLAKQLAEILELEDEELAATAKALRQRIGSALSSPDDQ